MMNTNVTLVQSETKPNMVTATVGENTYLVEVDNFNNDYLNVVSYTGTEATDDNIVATLAKERDLGIISFDGNTIDLPPLSFKKTTFQDVLDIVDRV